MIVRLLALGVVLLLSAPVQAQSNDLGMPSWAAPSSPTRAEAPMNNVDPDPPPRAPQQVPLDGGLSLLALAGGAYAVRRLRKDKA